jgi:hypothetical protein
LNNSSPYNGAWESYIHEDGILKVLVHIFFQK